MLKGSPKDYKMTPCRGHTDIITEILCLNEKLFSLYYLIRSTNGELLYWQSPNYSATRFIEDPIEKIKEINNNLLLVSKTGNISIINSENLQIISSHTLGLRDLILSIADNM